MEGRGPVADALVDAAFVRAMLHAEAALALAEAEAGLIPADHAARIAAACRTAAPEIAELGRGATESGTPVLPLLRHVRAGLDSDAGASFHLGATSQDILDTATMLVAAGAVGLIRADLDAAADAAAGLAERYAATPMTGRTLLQAARPTTFGAKCAAWLSGLDHAAARLAWLRDERLAVQLGGPVGTMAELGPHAADVLRSYAAQLTLAAPPIAWHAERGRIVELAGVLGLAAAAIAKPALDIVLLAQTEVGELSDAIERGASSSMSHKRNPVAAVAARSCAAQAPGLVANLVAAASGGEHERAAGAWQAEWRSLRELLRSVGSAAAWLRDALEHLVIDEARMRQNLAPVASPDAETTATDDAAAAERVVRAALVRHRERGTNRARTVALHRHVTGPEDRPALVLINSLGSTLAMWDPQVKELAQHFRVVRFDLRGHGASPVPPGPYLIGDLGADVLRLLDELELECVHLVGSSIGAMMALWVAAHAPERVDRLVVAGGSARLGPSAMWRERSRQVLAGGMSTVAAAVVGRWYTASYARQHPDEIERMQAMVTGCDPTGYAGCCVAIAEMDQVASLAAISAPTLVVVGTEDPSTPLEHAELLVDGIAQSRLAVMPQAAHLPNLEQPAAFSGLVLEHLGTVPQPAR